MSFRYSDADGGAERAGDEAVPARGVHVGAGAGGPPPLPAPAPARPLPPARALRALCASDAHAAAHI